ncbi:MAG TPA: AI-2E family transporter [Thermoleophilia bacterium]|nr:AI-2E family transporter [Thermoleophilia bacterium]
MTEPENQTTRAFAVPQWMREFGTSSWLIIGLVIVFVAALVLIAALRILLIPTLLAALLGSTFLPVADWLERHHCKRWLATLLTIALIVAIVAVVVLVVVVGVFHEFPTVQKNLQAALDNAQKWLKDHNVTIDKSQVKADLKKAGPQVVAGIASALVKGINDVAALIFGVFIGLNILAYILADGRRLGRWLSFHLRPIPQPTAYEIVRNASHFLRGYIWGSTIIGLFNGLVMGLGALVLGVPLAATIGIVGWITNYVPTFGAIIGGAFAVVIAYGSGGLTTALLMLLVVIVANGFLQTVVSQFALGAALKLHPMAVLFATTAGGLLFGAVGAVVAAPFLKIAIDSSDKLKAIGLFGPEAAAEVAAKPAAEVTEATEAAVATAAESASS